VAKQYRIDLIINAAQADQATARTVANAKGIGDAYDRAMKQAERAIERELAAQQRANEKAAADYDRRMERATRSADRRADAEVRAAEKAAAAQQRAQDRAAAAALKAVERELAAQQRVNAQAAADYDRRMERATRSADRRADAEVRAAEKAAAAQQRAQDRAAAAVQRAQDRAIEQAIRGGERVAAADARRAERAERDQAKVMERMLRESERMQSQQARAADRRADAEVRAQKRIADSQRQQMEAVFAELDRQGLEAREKLQDAMNMKLGPGGMGALAAIAGFAVQEFNAARDSAYQASKMVGEYREALLELAALKGRLGNTDKELGENLTFRRQTLQTREASIDFQNAMLGVGQSMINEDVTKPGITQAEFDRAMVMAGKFQAVEKGSARTHGELAGMLPQLMGRRVTAEDVAAKEQQLYKIFQPGGASFTSLAGQYSKLSPYITNGIYKDSEAAALLSAMSTVNPGGAGEMTQWLARGTVGGLGRMRGMGVAGSEKQGTYLARLGATNQMNPTQIADLISEDFKKQEVAAAAGGQQFNAMDYLRHHGYGNMEDIQALMAYHGLRKTGQMDKFMGLAREVPTATEAQREVEVAARADPAIMGRRADLALEQADVSVGVGAPEYYRRLEKMAFGKLKANRTWGINGEYEDYGKMSPMSLYTVPMVQDQMRNMMNEQRKAVGLPSMAQSERDWQFKDPVGYARERLKPDWEERRYFRSAQEVAERGGDTLPGNKDLLLKLDEQLEESKKLRQAVERGLGRGDGGRPAPPPMRRAAPAPP
jgi:hypothetical protein